MAQSTINERLKILIEALGFSARAFSLAIGSGDTNTRNYLDRGSKPSSDYLEKIVRRFDAVNSAWLLTGEGQMFLSEQTGVATQTGNFNQAGTRNKQTIKGNKGNLQTGDGSTINNLTLADCKTDLEKAQREIEYLRGQLQMQETVLAAKEETITLLRASFNRPN